MLGVYFSQIDTNKCVEPNEYFLYTPPARIENRRWRMSDVLIACQSRGPDKEP